LTSISLNANSVVNKITELRQRTKNMACDIIGITESWASDAVNDAELHIDGYNM